MEAVETVEVGAVVSGRDIWCAMNVGSDGRNTYCIFLLAWQYFVSKDQKGHKSNHTATYITKQRVNKDNAIPDEHNLSQKVARYYKQVHKQNEMRDRRTRCKNVGLRNVTNKH